MDLILPILFGIAFCYAIVKFNRILGDDLGKKRQCPMCHKYGMKSKSGGYYMNGNRVSDWECPHCGHRFTS